MSEQGEGWEGWIVEVKEDGERKLHWRWNEIERSLHGRMILVLICTD